MTNSTTPPGETGGSGPLGEQEQLWWDRLGGKPVPAGDAKTIERAEAIRKAVLEQHRADMQDDANDPHAEERARQQVLFEARRRGLMGSGSRYQDRRRWLGGLAAAVLLGVVVVYQVRRDDEDDGPKLRGDIPVQKLTDPDPPKRAQSIASSLRQAGVEVRVHPGKKATWIEIEVLPENFEAVKPVLERAGIAARPGQVLVRIEKP